MEEYYSKHAGKLPDRQDLGLNKSNAILENLKLKTGKGLTDVFLK